MTDEQLHKLDHYLQELELPFRSSVVIALIRDALAGTGDPPDIISRRIYQIAGVILPGEEAPLLFEQLIFDLYKDVEKGFDKDEDSTFSPMRSRILDLLDKWMQLSDFLYEEEQNQLSGRDEIQLEMNELLKFLHSLLDRLNDPEHETPDSAKELSFLLDQSEEVFTRFMHQVEELLNPHTSVTPVEDGSEKILHLRVELKDAGHPVWREFTVSGLLPLSRFHLVLQKVMGWWDLYDHSFEQGGSFWGTSAEDDDSVIYQDEEECPVQSLLTEEDDMLHYCYDLPEGWHHVVLVQDALDASAGAAPRCLKGRGACPPEDCGGPEGFRMLLASLKPDAPADLKEDFAWVGDYDPDEFDADAVNEELGNLIL